MKQDRNQSASSFCLKQKMIADHHSDYQLKNRPMLVTWNDFNRPSPSRGDGTLGEKITPGVRLTHKGLFFIYFGYNEGN
jgi:hypothetical protein